MFEKLKNKVTMLAYIIIFFGLYIFFRYADPIVPWVGDDWNTFGSWGLTYFLFNLPQEALANYNIFSNAIGSLSGWIAAFIVYPITGDYIASIMSVDAAARAFAAVVSIFSIVWLLSYFTKTKKHLAIGIGLFLAFAFTFMKVSSPSQCLFWTYNRCAIYYYCIPSYLGTAFSIYLLGNYIMNIPFKCDFRTGVCLGALYILMFSFFPVAVLIAIVSGVIVVYDLCKKENIQNLILFKENWFYFLALILFLIKMYHEFFRTFSTGYLSTPDVFSVALIDSFKVLILSFFRMHFLFKVAAFLGGILAISSLGTRYSKSRFNEDDKKWLELIILLLIIFFVLFIFYILFGTISLAQHIVSYDRIFYRMDTLYGLYFLFFLLIILAWIYTLEHWAKSVVVLPILMIMMLCVVVNPQNPYSDSVYIDSTFQQKYEIMSAVVEAMQAKDKCGEKTLIVHMPAYAHYGSGGMTVTLQYHNITNSFIRIEFVYNAKPNEIWFE